MAPIVRFDRFDVQKAQDCLQYLADSFEWLTANEDNFTSISDQLNWPQLLNMSKTATTLLSKICQVHNRFPPINQLPPEVLALVFKHLMLRREPRAAVSPPKRITWPVVSRVCGYWRRIARYTPGLWTIIQAPLHGFQGASACRNFALLSLERSFPVPFSVQYHEGYTTGPDTIPFEDILLFLPRMHELTLFGGPLTSLRLLTQPAQMLQTFMVYMSEIFDHSTEAIPALFEGWQTPRLETLLMSGCRAWHKLSIRHLRRLVISDQTFHPESITSLFHILTLNTRIEDLLIRDIYCEAGEIQGLQEALAKIPPFVSSSLKRICILDKDYTAYPVLATALNPKIIAVSDDWFRYLDFSYKIDRGSGPALPQAAGVVPRQNVITPYTLAILDTVIIASDGHRCFHLIIRPKGGMNPLDVVRATIQPTEVRELWLSTKDRRFASFLEDMQQLTTIVFPELGASSVAVWLKEITERKLFRKLEDVRVWTRSKQDGSGRPLLNFLKHRQEMGQRIRMLRFLKHPDIPNDIHCTFDRWRAEPKKFRRVVDHVQVIFEEPSERPRMQLPDVCEFPWPIEENMYPPAWP